MNPRAAGPIAPKQAIRVRRNTAITQPLSTQPFARQQREAARHVARSIIHITTGRPAPVRPLRDSEVRAVIRSPAGRQILASAEKITRQPAMQHHRSFLSKAVHFAFGGGSYGLGTQASAPGEGPSRIAVTAAKAGVQTARAFGEHPIGVTEKTAGGFGQLAIGLVGAVPELAIKTGQGTLHGDPLRGVKDLGKAAAADYSRRYGGLYRGDPGAGKAFRQRILKEGAASEIVDAATIAAPEGAIVGRSLGKLARAGKLGEGAQRLATEARPALRTSGDAARPQELSRNLIRASGQRVEDVVRQRALARRNAKAAARDKPISGLQPRKTRVVSPGKTVQVAGREIQVFDPKATRKAIARQERRRIDKPFIQPNEVADFQKGAKYSGVMYHVTDPKTAELVAKRGLDPAKAQRGTYGLGTYSASVPEDIPGATRSVKVAVRMRNPLVIESDKAMTALKPFRDAAVAKVGTGDLRLLSAEMTRELQRAGYDGVVVKGAMRGGDYVVNFHPQDVRVIGGGNVARRGGRTSAVLERNLPAATLSRPGRDVHIGEKTAPTREVVAATKAGQRRLQRIEVSKIATNVYENFKSEQAREVHAGASKNISKLNKHQRAAAVTAIQGLVTAHDPAAAIRQLEARNAEIRANRAADTAERAKHGLGSRPIPKNIHGDELALNQYLIDHAKEIFNHKFAAFQKAEAERSIRVAGEQADVHPAFRSSTAEVRRLRPQGEALKVPYPYEVARHAIESEFRSAAGKATTGAGVAEAKAVRDEALSVLEKRKPAIDAQYAADVRAKARAAGLPEPGFVSHHPRPDYGFSDFAPGGARAIASPRRSELVLHRLGIADTHPARYIQSLARTVKYKHNWPGVVAQAEAHAFDQFEIGTEQELRTITGRKGRLNPDSLSIEDWRKILHAKGLNPADYAFWNPGLMRAAKAEFDTAGHVSEHLDVGTGPEGAPGVFEGWQSAAVAAKKFDELPAAQRETYLQTRGWKLLPKAAYDEITSGTKPSGAGLRFVSKFQAGQSRVLLGLNPSWIQFQVLANTLQSTFGVAAKAGNPADFVNAIRFYNRQPADVRHEIDIALSNGIFSAHGERVHLGASANNDLVQKLRQIGEHPAFQKAKHANPVNVIFRLDHAQNAYFRKVVMYSSLKREALHDMARKVGLTVELQKKIADVLAIKDPEARMRAIIRDPQLFEIHAEYVNDILGDYSRFTSRERRYLKRSILFWGFYRYALRTMFYTLPVKHPLAAAAAAKLSQLHNSEVADLLGGPDAPWAYSRVFFQGKDGKLSSIDFARANPIATPITDISSEGVSALGGFVSPAVQAVSDQLYGKSLYTGQAFHVKGSAEDNPNPDPTTRGRIMAAEMLNTAFPYRELVKLTQSGAKQGDDSLLFSPRPIHYKTPQAQGREQVRLTQAGSGVRQVTRDLAPFVQPKADLTRDVVAERRRKAGKTLSGGKGGKATTLKGIKLPAIGSAGATGLKGVKLPPIGG